MTTPRVVIIGAGIVGASLADELSLRGWNTVTVVEAGSLPAAGGSTSHAPGVVFQTNSSRVMTQFARYTAEKLLGLRWDNEPCFLDVGSVEIATTPERVAELARRHGYAQSWGVPGARLLSTDEVLEKWDLLNRDRVLAGLFVPGDGIARSVNAVAAQLARAQAAGVSVLDNTPVTGLVILDGRVVGVSTAGGDIAADVVVCCAGIWGPVIAEMAGVTLPLTPLAHQLAWSSPLDELADRTVEASRPVLRHQDSGLYYRERGNTIGVGSYRHRAMPLSAHDLRPWGEATMPSVEAFTPDDFAWPLAESVDMIPALAAASWDDAINGIFSFTPDGMPLMGPTTVEGFWVAEAIWVTHSAGVAKAMAEWIIDGASSSFDLHACDVNRFEVHEKSPAYILARDSQNFVEVYDIVHPLQPMEHSRPLRTSPFYPRQQALGGQFLEAHGWERPNWYESNAGLLAASPATPQPTPGPWAARFWSPIVAAEATTTRSAVALYDMTALRRISVSGRGATEFLQSMVTANIAKSVGSVTYCLMLGEDGGIRSDITVARLGAEEYQIGVNGEADLDWLGRHLHSSTFADTVRITDITPGTCCIGVWGPDARRVVQSLTGTDLGNDALKYFRATTAYLATVHVTIMRLSYVGELGFEIYTNSDQGLVLWDLLMAAGADFGIIAAGRSAFNSLRIEKGYRSFGTDMSHDHDPYEAGLGFAVRLDKGDFIGKAALLARKDTSVRRLVLLRMTHPNELVLGNEPVFVDGIPSAVGYVTSASYSYTLGASLAYAWLPTSCAEPGTPVEVEYFGERYSATVTAEPAFDPGMERIRR
ncbi:MAG: FAD-dependent oxidoreductase [Glaciihabitans sp.]|nr:FAD-dependent oxidoreductase [Glaciihabitans sp.]